jgi:DNA-binding XRE family transcriptional regulator
MSYGYSRSLVEANKKASIKSLGVALGRLCIKHEVSVSELAKELSVSRMTIYNWFWGVRTPTIHLQPRVVKYIEYLKKRK